MSVYVGIDVHRKRSQVAVVTEDGKVQLNKNTVNGTEPILRLIGDLPAGTPVAFEAAFGWGWLVRLLEDYGFDPHLVHPLQCKAIASARLKNDKVDAATLAQLLRADLLPEAWIAPSAVRQLRALLRHRAGLVRLRTQRQNRIHAVVADFGFDRSGSYLSGPGRGWLAELELPVASREIVADCLAVTGRPGGEGPGRPSPPLPAVEVHRRDTGRRDHPNANHGTRPLPDSEALTTPNVTKHMRRSGGGHVETAWKPRGACPGPSAE